MLGALCLVGVLVNKLFLVRRVVVCPSGGWVMMFFSAASARVWGLVSGCVLVCVLTWLCVGERERERSLRCADFV